MSTDRTDGAPELKEPQPATRTSAAQRFFPGLASKARENRHALVSIGMIASSNVVASALGVIGSLVQARFIFPDELGFVRKYSIISNYALFFSLGLFSIMQREYCVLIGKGETNRAFRAVAITQSWCFSISALVGVVLGALCAIELWNGDIRAASALFIQIIAVWGILYGGYLTNTFRSGQEFKNLANSSFLASVAGVVVLPFFAIWPFATFVVRSIAGPIVTMVYLHRRRPVKVGFLLPWREFLTLVKRGLRLFVGNYLRYIFWLSVEIWMMLSYAGDTGVGLLVFSSMIAVSASQLATAVNQVYMPRLAEHYGRTGSMTECLKMSLKPTLVNLATATTIILLTWWVLPPLMRLALPKYVTAIPLINVLVLDTLIVACSLPLYMVIVTEGYFVEAGAAIIGLAVFLGLAFLLHSKGMNEMAVIWGTLAGRLAFAIVAFLGVLPKMRTVHTG